MSLRDLIAPAGSVFADGEKGERTEDPGIAEILRRAADGSRAGAAGRPTGAGGKNEAYHRRETDVLGNERKKNAIAEKARARAAAATQPRG